MARISAFVRKDNNDIFTAAGSARTLNADDAGKIVQLATLAGSTVTLPAALGTGNVYTCVVTALATSNSHIIKVANSTDVMRGVLFSVDTDSADAVGPFAATTASDTITLNRSTTGSVSIGETIRLRDVAPGFWQVEGWFGATGVPATPFSATV